MNNYFVILGAGKSKRFHKNIAKQFYNYKNKDVIEHSIDKSLSSKLFKKVVVVVNNPKKINKKKYSKNITVIKGGRERSESSLLALKYIKKYKPKNVFIHDAARPNFTHKLLKNLVLNLKKNKAVIPIIKTRDSIKYRMRNKIFNLDKEKAFFTQTPQAFRYSDLYKLATQKKNKISDEATLFLEKNYKVKFISGESQNNKITFYDDIKLPTTYFGIGFDVHRLIKNKKLYLGGINIPFHSGLRGHSDGDVILHAIIDSILGAMKKKDIGTYFPDNEKEYKNIRSPKMLRPILDDLYKKNFLINNLDINLICEQPKVSIYRNKIINSISSLMKLEKDKINLKGKTTEKLGLIGKEKAVACEVIVSITNYD